MVGELEIIGSLKIGDKERATRLEVLKKLAYNHEILTLKEVLTQYASFVSKVEKGKFKWGNK